MNMPKFRSGQSARRADLALKQSVEIMDRGHQVANHTYRHSRLFWFYPPWLLRREITQAQEALEDGSGQRPHLFRAPAGIRSFLLEPVLAGMGLTLVTWSRRGFDAISRDPYTVLRRLEPAVKAGSILLLHDGSFSRHPNQAVLKTLPRLFDLVRERGLKTVPLTRHLLRESD